MVVRLVAQQYSFEPQCMLVPADTPVTFRGTSSDVIHGFVIGTTNANVMLIPGYVATFTATFRKPGEHLMPCHEKRGTAHAAMWARFQVMRSRSSWRKPAGRGSPVFLAKAARLLAFLGRVRRVRGARAGRVADVRAQPLSDWVGNPEHYYRSVTAHGTVMGRILPTLVAMGFGYAITGAHAQASADRA